MSDTQADGGHPAREPRPDCPLCPRLVAFRAENQLAFPGWFNAPVPCFGDRAGWLLIVGLAPGLRGANRTGRPFTGDHAGILLYETLLGTGLAEGAYGAEASDGMRLVGCRIANAVRCVPPANKPTPAEAATCHRFLRGELDAMAGLRAVLALGVLAHEAVLRGVGVRLAAAKFAHGAVHALPGGQALLDSYHVSRYNTSTRRLTAQMFQDVVQKAKEFAPSPPLC